MEPRQYGAHKLVSPQTPVNVKKEEKPKKEEVFFQKVIRKLLYDNYNVTYPLDIPARFTKYNCILIHLQ
jgi:hypothetical protein